MQVLVSQDTVVLTNGTRQTADHIVAHGTVHTGCNGFARKLVRISASTSCVNWYLGAPRESWPPFSASFLASQLRSSCKWTDLASPRSHRSCCRSSFPSPSDYSIRKQSRSPSHGTEPYSHVSVNSTVTQYDDHGPFPVQMKVTTDGNIKCHLYTQARIQDFGRGGQRSFEPKGGGSEPKS